MSTHRTEPHRPRPKPGVWQLRCSSIDGSSFDTLDGPRVGRGDLMRVIEAAPVIALLRRLAARDVPTGECPCDICEAVRAAEAMLELLPDA